MKKILICLMLASCSGGVEFEDVIQRCKEFCAFRNSTPHSCYMVDSMRFNTKKVLQSANCKCHDGTEIASQTSALFMWIR